MAETSLDLNAPILPAEGLGGMRVGTNIGRYEAVILGVWKAAQAHGRKVPFELASPFEIRYPLAQGAVEVVVDVRTGTVARLSASRGYSGKLFGALRVGLRVADALKLDDRLYYERESRGVSCRGVPGVVLEIPMVDVPASIVPDQIICAITVFDPGA